MALTDEQQRQRESRSELQRALGAVGVKFTGKACKCPFHDDKHASAGVFETGGVWKFKCHGCGFCGDIFDVKAKLEGREMKEVLKESKGQEPPRTETKAYKPQVFAKLDDLVAVLNNVSAVYKYTNPDTSAIDLIVVRQEFVEGKLFKQASQVSGGFVMKAPEGKLPIYNRTRVKSSSEVVVVEGEKCVHALAEVGIVATTSPGGAGKAHMADWSPLAGKTCYLWPDNDAPDPKTKVIKGFAHMDSVQEILERLNPPATVKRVDISELELPVKGDAVDYIEANEGTAEDKRIAVQLVLGQSRRTGGSKVLSERFGKIVTGKFRSIEWPWPRLSSMAMCLMPGTITSVCADPGAGKSFKTIQSFFHFHMGGLKVSLYELEGKSDYHLNRLLAQIEGDSRLANPTWVEENPDEAFAALERHSDLLDSFAPHMFTSPEKPPSLTFLSDWVIEQAESGCAVIGIDPITAAEASERPWIEDQKFIFKVKPVLERTDARLILVTHPRTSPGKNPNTQMSNMAGGAAYPRFSDSVLWLEVHHKPKKADVAQLTGVYATTFNRSIQMRKARNGPGAGKELAFNFIHDTLRFEEVGLVMPEDSERNVSAFDTKNYY